MSFGKKVRNKWWFSIFKMAKLPSLWFWGVKVVGFTERHCSISIKYSWYSKNPFQSIYFSALSGAGELSTGLLVQNKAMEKSNVSMLVVHAESHFTKKATGTIIFTCNEGEAVTKSFESLQKAGDQTKLVLRSVGVNELGEEVANFMFTWSLKKR
ncbi:MAG: DUF4442 domain-containing protein [Saprospiraceae bacterium]